MARTSKSRGASPFSMRSSNRTAFKMMGSSPARKTTETDPVKHGGLLPEVTVQDKKDEIIIRDLTEAESKERKIGDPKYNITGTKPQVRENITTGKKEFISTTTDAEQQKKYQETKTSKDKTVQQLRDENFKKRLRASGTKADMKVFARKFPGETF